MHLGTLLVLEIGQGESGAAESPEGLIHFAGLRAVVEAYLMSSVTSTSPRTPA